LSFLICFLYIGNRVIASHTQSSAPSALCNGWTSSPGCGAKNAPPPGAIIFAAYGLVLWCSPYTFFVYGAGFSTCICPVHKKRVRATRAIRGLYLFDLRPLFLTTAHQRLRSLSVLHGTFIYPINVTMIDMWRLWEIVREGYLNN
jgi:hypothetical protein